MLKELVQFIDSLDIELKAVGMMPREGLHIFLRYETVDNKVSISKTFTYEVFSKKQQELSPPLKTAASLAQVAWMVNTNKCFRFQLIMEDLFYLPTNTRVTRQH